MSVKITVEVPFVEVELDTLPLRVTVEATDPAGEVE